MRINKGQLIYVRLMVVGLVVFFGVLTIIGCRSMAWFKPGATEAEFNKDVYECMRENQQVVSRTYGNRYGVGSSSGVTVSEEMYNACMMARGYSLKEQ